MLDVSESSNPVLVGGYNTPGQSVTVIWGGNGARTISVNYTTTYGFSAVHPGTLKVYVKPVPPTPEVSLSGSLPDSSLPDRNQWYFNENAIPGANGQTFTAIRSGNCYTIINLQGCYSDSSNHVQVILAGKEEISGASLYPRSIRSPVKKLLRVTMEMSLGIMWLGLISDHCGKEYTSSGLSRNMAGLPGNYWLNETRSVEPGRYHYQEINLLNRVHRK